MPRREYQPNCKRQRSLSNKLKHRHTRNRDQVFSHRRSVPLSKNAAKLEGRKQHDALDKEVQRFQNKTNSQIKEMNLWSETREEIQKLKRQAQQLNYEVSQQTISLRKTMEKSEEALQKRDIALAHVFLEQAKLHRAKIDAICADIDAIQRQIGYMKREIKMKQIREAPERQRILTYKEKL